MKETSENRFSPRERASSYQAEIKTKRRQTGESVADFGHSLRRLAIKAYPNCSFASVETHVIDQFIYGLGDIDLRKHVQFNHPSTIDKAIALAVEYESFVGKCDERRKPGMNQVRFEDEFASRTRNNVEKDDMAKIEEIQKALGSYRSRNNMGAYQSSYSNAFDSRNDHVQNQLRNTVARNSDWVKEGRRLFVIIVKKLDILRRGVPRTLRTLITMYRLQIRKTPRD